MRFLEQFEWYKRGKVIGNSIGFVGERKAVALAVLGFFALVLVLNGIALRAQPPELAKLAPMFLALGGCYLLGFFALGADWFWSRWFAIGLGNAGVSLAVWAVVMTRDINPVILILGASHGALALCLMGEKVAALFDGRDAWKKRFKLDDEGVLRLRRSVTRGAASLPGLIVLVLGPRNGAASLALMFFGLLGASGLFGVLRNKSWGVLALGAAGVGALFSTLGVLSTPAVGLAMPAFQTFGSVPAIPMAEITLISGALLLLSALPFLRPALRHLSARR